METLCHQSWLRDWIMPLFTTTVNRFSTHLCYQFCFVWKFEFVLLWFMGNISITTGPVIINIFTINQSKTNLRYHNLLQVLSNLMMSHERHLWKACQLSIWEQKQHCHSRVTMVTKTAVQCKHMLCPPTRICGLHHLCLCCIIRFELATEKKRRGGGMGGGGHKNNKTC